MKKLVLFVLIGMMGYAFSSCDKEKNNTIKGKVFAYDADLEETFVAKGATCSLHNGNAEAYIQTATVNEAGAYTFEDVPDGEYQISAKFTDTEHFAQPTNYSARTASKNVSGGKTINMEDIICK